MTAGKFDWDKLEGYEFKQVQLYMLQGEEVKGKNETKKSKGKKKKSKKKKNIVVASSPIRPPTGDIGVGLFEVAGLSSAIDGMASAAAM